MWTRFWRLSNRQRRLLISAVAMLPVAAIRVRLFGAPRAVAAAPASPPQADEPTVVREAARMVKAAAHYVPLHLTCLPQSIVLQQLLRREGVVTTMRIGVRKRDGTLDGHAWVEYNGRPVSDPSSVQDDFQVLHADSSS